MKIQPTAADLRTLAPPGAGSVRQPQAPAPSADPYAGNAAPGASEFPLAAPAGTDSRARLRGV